MPQRAEGVPALATASRARAAAEAGPSFLASAASLKRSSDTNRISRNNATTRSRLTPLCHPERRRRRRGGSNDSRQSV